MDKKLKKSLKILFEVIIEEADKNEEFEASLSKLFESSEKTVKSKSTEGGKRGSNRRDKAVLDPIKLVEEGALERRILEDLSDKELKDIIAEYGMDPSKLAMKWKDRDRVINLIMDTAQRRASKGDAFRN